MPTTKLTDALHAVARALHTLADAIDDAAPAPPTSPPAHRAADPNPWPDLMSTAMAARYCCYKSTSAIRKAHQSGRLFPAGKRGARRSWTWLRADLDAYMRGDGANAAADARRDRPADATNTQGPTASSAPRPAREQRQSRPSRRPLPPEVEASLQRIKALARDTESAHTGAIREGASPPRGR